MSVNVKSGGSRVVLANKAQNYVLPVASDSTLGGIKVGENLSIDANGILAATDTIYELPAATTSTLGGVIIDNSTITVDNDGTIHAVAYVLPTASTSTLGGIKVGDNLSVETDGTLNAVDPVSIIIDTQAGNDSTYSSNKILQLINAIKSFDVEIVAKLPTVGDPHKIYFVLRKQLEEENIYDEYMYINEEWEKIGSTEIHISIATTDTAGIVKPDGITITVAADGTISAVQYTLPAATTSTLGGVKADGTTITVDNDGTIHGASTYTLPAATTSTLGGVIPDGETITVDIDGTIHGASTYELPVATTSTLGGVKVDGDSISADVDGTIHGAKSVPLESYQAYLDGIEAGTITVDDDIDYYIPSDGEFIPDKRFLINEWTILSTAWVSSTVSEKYPYQATIETDKYSTSFIANFIDIIPADDSAFFSDDEEEAKALLNQNIAFTATGFTLYAKEAITCNLKLRISGEA